VGSTVNEAEIVGTLAGTSKSPVHVHPHLHVSLAQPSDRASYENLTWRHLSDPELFTMTDPLSVIAALIDSSSGSKKFRTDLAGQVQGFLS